MNKKNQTNNNRAKEVLTTDEAAALLGVSSETVAKYARNGVIPCRKIGNRCRYSRQALLDWLGESND